MVQAAKARVAKSAGVRVWASRPRPLCVDPLIQNA
jgi:hypothetical protein